MVLPVLFELEELELELEDLLPPLLLPSLPPQLEGSQAVKIKTRQISTYFIGSSLSVDGKGLPQDGASQVN